MIVDPLCRREVLRRVEVEETAQSGVGGEQVRLADVADVQSIERRTQAALAVKEGMEPASALRAITINPATVMGVADRVGSLEKGKDADVVLWNGDPLDIRNRVLRTFVSGDEVYSWDPDTRQATWASRY